MRSSALLLVAMLIVPTVLRAQALPGPSGPVPTLEEVRRDMGIPSRGLELRGQRDTVGFASTIPGIARAWESSAFPPAPDSLGPLPEPGVAAVICPHDDYLYAGRVYHRVLPLLTARVVVLVGVFHRYRRFGEHDRLVFDPYQAWRCPDGRLPVSPVREELLAKLPKADYVQDAAMHDSEHSVEALAYWLRHCVPGVEIVPVIVPAARFERMAELGEHLGGALAEVMKAHGWKLGRDVAVAISTDAVHYGPDFKHTPFGEGGIEAYTKAVERDRALLLGPLAGPLTREKIRTLYETFVNPENPDDYRLTWCGRFALPLGLLVLERAARDAGGAVGHPVAYATSVGWPELPVRAVGMGATAPANLYHFVGYPAVAYTLEAK
ncbi:MAG TPA: AmmeMemoRadiSam system protein B [Candidatus Saccharimonadales bacterium]|nr:AmmeMemoRadiSam system protein B [Candidatus Saccharimonadales bacterium]